MTAGNPAVAITTHDGHISLPAEPAQLLQDGDGPLLVFPCKQATAAGRDPSLFLPFPEWY